MNMIGFNNGQKRNIQTKRYYWVRAGRIQHKIKEFLKFIKNDENQPPHNIILHLIDIWGLCNSTFFCIILLCSIASSALNGSVDGHSFGFNNLLSFIMQNNI